MNKRCVLAILLIFAGALAFRLYRIDIRPFHNDEAVNAVKVTELWQHGVYKYDPDEYHGPVLHYATLPFLWLSGARGTDNLPDRTLRLAPVAFGASLILLLFLFRDAFGVQALVWSAIFLAISPAMVFYSRYFIHEMLLVFFSALGMAAGWRYSRTHSPGWLILAGVSVGLMFATKETFVLTLAAATAAGLLTAWPELRGALSTSKQSFSDSLEKENDGASRKSSGRRTVLRITNLREILIPHFNTRDVVLALFATFLVWLLFFSSFFTNIAGLPDSVRTYFPWLKRAAGHSPHLHPWYFYLQRLGWFHPVKGPVFSEGLILILAVIGGVASFRTREKDGAALFLRFLTYYTLILAAVYSAISYKTPWCMLGFLYGLILLAGAGAAALTGFFTSRVFKLGIFALLIGFTLQLAFQSARANFEYASDRRNPYVYAQTVPDVLNLVHRVEGLARANPAGFGTVVKVIAPDSDYWPLPWYLRRFNKIGWYDTLPEDPFSPVIIVDSSLDSRLDERSGRKWIMAGVTEFRPGKFFELYVELSLWSKYVESLPPEPD